MQTKPDLSDALLLAHLESAYGLRLREITFLPVGADSFSAAYRLTSEAGEHFFLKLRSGAFDANSVDIPLWLHKQGIHEILAPLEAQTGASWTQVEGYRTILYPFIEGQDAAHTDFPDAYRLELGRALRQIHDASLPAELQGRLAQESFSPKWREALKGSLRQVEDTTFDEPYAAKLAHFMQDKRDAIRQLLERTEELAQQVSSPPRKLVLCHTDLHAWNLLISNEGALYIVDWDAPLLAPRERDLMFIGSGVDQLWPTAREQGLFHEGYGPVRIDAAALAYYRYERIIEDMAVECERLFESEGGGEDRQNAFEYFAYNFAPGNTLQRADEAYAAWRAGASY